MQKIIIKYFDLATTSKSKLKATEEENKLKEEMTALRKSFDARLVEKENQGWEADALSKLD